jgi:hypothetical protein
VKPEHLTIEQEFYHDLSPDPIRLCSEQCSSRVCPAHHFYRSAYGRFGVHGTPYLARKVQEYSNAEHVGGYERIHFGSMGQNWAKSRYRTGRRHREVGNSGRALDVCLGRAGENRDVRRERT